MSMSKRCLLRRRRVGCFKPYDEEAFAPLNPRGVFGQLGDTVFQRGILSGEACEREVAAYLLDKVISRVYR